MDICAFIHSLQHIESTGAEGRQGTASLGVVHSCQNKQWLTSSAVGSIPA